MISVKYHHKNKTHRGEIDEFEKVYLGNFTVRIIWNRINNVATVGVGHSLENAIEWALVAYAETLGTNK